MGFPTDIPFNAGGLYYSFSTTIIDNNFQYPINIPYYTSYGVPFAYNPLIFYFIAFFSTITKIPPLLFHIYLPTIFSVISVFSFFFFANIFFKDKGLVLASVFFYSILPQAFSELLPGEGLVESYGTLFFIIGMITIFKFYKSRENKYLFLSGIIFGLTLLGSPGGGFAFALSIIIIPLFKQKWRFASTSILTMLTLGAIISLPWWLTVISNHGINTLIYGILTKNLGIFEYLAKILYFDAGNGWTFGAAFVLLGIAYCVVVNKWLLPIWFIVIFIAGEITYIVPVIASLLMALGLIKVIIFSFNHIKSKTNITKMVIPTLILLICVHGIGNAINYDVKFHYSNNLISYKELTTAERTSIEAAKWIQNNSSQLSRFVIIGDHEHWTIGDWLPVLIKKPVINIIYGVEWTGNSSDIRKMDIELQKKIKVGDIRSSEKIANDFGTYFTHLFIVKSNETEEITFILRESDLLEHEYENNEIIIFKIKN